MEDRRVETPDPQPFSVALRRARSHHGTWLARAPDGTTRLTADAGDPDLLGLLVLPGSRAVLSAGPGEARALAHPTLMLSEPDVDGARPALVLDDGRRLTATPHGAIEPGEGPIEDWERFTLEPLEPSSRPVATDLADLLGTGIVARLRRAGSDPAAIERLCLSPHPRLTPAMALVLACACLDVLPEERIRAILPSLSAMPAFDRLYPVVQRRLSGGQRRTEWHTRAHLRAVLDRPGWRIGDHTYGAPEIVDGEYGTLEIGRYCSIAGGVRIVVSNHTTRALTTYPFTALRRFWPSARAGMPDHVGRGVVVGDAVWIGAGVCLLPGARIGSGAILGAHAVVAGTVPPYAVVVGNPGRVSRLQHPPDTIERLLAAAWWDWPDHEVDRAIPLLLGDDAEALLAHADNRRASAPSRAPPPP